MWSVALLVLSVAAQGALANEHGGVHVATWRWDEVGVFITFTSFTILCGLARIAFHYAHWLSSRIPESCLMITVGVAVGAIIFFANQPVDGNFADYIVNMLRESVAVPKFTPRSFFFILLPPVILEAAYSLYDKAFADNVGTVLLFAVVGTIFNIFTIGPLLYWLASIGAMGWLPFELRLIDCLVFSTLIAAVDPVAVLAIFQEIGINKDLYYLVFGESLFNDAVTVVLYATMVTFHGMSHIPGGQYGIAVVAFLASSIGGSAIGAAFGLVTAVITRTTQQNELRVVEPLAVLGVAYLSYLAAELFHFSGILSIIACGLVQAHYALRNVSRKSHTTVIYFTKMISSTSEAIIFLFLGIVIVSDTHVWSTGFVLWSLFLCFVCRSAGVYILTAMANLVRSTPIKFKEQLILAYGGLRGAIAFSLVQTIDQNDIQAKQLLVTTTLVVIFFTVFVQGGTIKPIVGWLSIKRDSTGKRRMCEEINENLVSNVIAGIEEITGVRRDHFIKKKLTYIDETFMQRLFLVSKPKDELTRLNTKLFLTDHFAHLYGPVHMGEENRARVFRPEPDVADPGLQMVPLPPSANGSLYSGDIYSLTVPEFDGKTRSRSSTFTSGANSDIMSTDILRRSFRNYPHEKFSGEEPLSSEERQARMDHLLVQRQMTARRITEMVGPQPLANIVVQNDPDDPLAPVFSIVENSLPDYSNVITRQ